MIVKWTWILLNDELGFDSCHDVFCVDDNDYKFATMLGVQAQKVLVRGLSVSSPAMERDLVNFPQRTRPIEKAPVRMLIFPEEWFTALYSKTGVTGPYMFLAGMGTFLCSKEYFVMEHDFYVGIALACVLTGIVKQVGRHHPVAQEPLRLLIPGGPRLD